MIKHLITARTRQRVLDNHAKHDHIGAALSMALATIPEAIQSPLHVDEPAEETVTVVILRGDESVEVEVLRKVELRHVQKCLCNAFHERFPLMCANLTNAEGRTLMIHLSRMQNPTRSIR